MIMRVMEWGAKMTAVKTDSLVVGRCAALAAYSVSAEHDREIPH